MHNNNKKVDWHKAQYKNITVDLLLHKKEAEMEKSFCDEIYKDEYYFKNGFEVNRDMTVVDVGAHVGMFAILCAKLGASVVAFEPVVENYNLLVENVALNDVSDLVDVFPYAVRSVSGLISMNIHNIEDRNTGKHYVSELGAFSNSDYIQKTAQAIRFTDVLNELTVDYLKLDCEGSEYDIIYNTDKDLIARIPMISMEFHNSIEDGKKLEEYLKSLGYETFLDWSYGEQGRLQARK